MNLAMWAASRKQSYILATVLLINSKISGESVQGLWQVTYRIILTLWKGHPRRSFSLQVIHMFYETHRSK